MWDILLICFATYIVGTSMLWTLGAILYCTRHKDKTEELTKLLGELTCCISSATSEDYADKVFGPCCYGVLADAIKWLDKNDPIWWESRFSSLDFLDEKETT